MDGDNADLNWSPRVLFGCNVSDRRSFRTFDSKSRDLEDEEGGHD